MRELPDQARDELIAEQKSDGDNYVDFMILFEASRWEWNDLASTRSAWTVSALDAALSAPFLQAELRREL